MKGRESFGLKAKLAAGRRGRRGEVDEKREAGRGRAVGKKQSRGSLSTDRSSGARSINTNLY